MRTLRAVVVGALALGLAATAAPAWAHNALVGTDPADGSTVDSVDAVEVEFAQEVMDIGLRVDVVDADGASVATGEPRVEDSRFVVQDTEPLGAGDYRVTWRVVGEDGHPIKGDFSFTVAGQPEPEPTPVATPASTPAAASGAQQQAPPVTGEPSLDASGWTLTDDGAKVLTGLGALLVIVLGTRFAIARARRP